MSIKITEKMLFGLIIEPNFDVVAVTPVQVSASQVDNVALFQIEGTNLNVIVEYHNDGSLTFSIHEEHINLETYKQYIESLPIDFNSN